MVSDDQVFVIMQIGQKDSAERRRADEVFTFVVKPAVEAHGLTPYRADLDLSPGAITPKLLGELIASRVVIADLTGRNPNVFYELGITHSFSRPLITIAESSAALPFDAKDERVIELGPYPETGLAYAQGETARKSLELSLGIVLEDGYVPPSPVREAAGTQSLDALAPENPLAAELGLVRETLDLLRLELHQFNRPTMSPATRANYIAMRDVLEQAATTGKLDSEDLLDLITNETGPKHDQWVSALQAKAATAHAAAEPNREGAPDPWASPKPTAKDAWSTGTSNDEPPF